MGSTAVVLVSLTNRPPIFILCFCTSIKNCFIYEVMLSNFVNDKYFVSSMVMGDLSWLLKVPWTFYEISCKTSFGCSPFSSVFCRSISDTFQVGQLDWFSTNHYLSCHQSWQSLLLWSMTKHTKSDHKILLIVGMFNYYMKYWGLGTPINTNRSSRYGIESTFFGATLDFANIKLMVGFPSLNTQKVYCCCFQYALQKQKSSDGVFST